MKAGKLANVYDVRRSESAAVGLVGQGSEKCHAHVAQQHGHAALDVAYSQPGRVQGI
jgi:hypothetical protein